MISGAAAGTGVDLILFPLDTFKTRIQSKLFMHYISEFKFEFCSLKLKGKEGFWRSGTANDIFSF